MLQIDVAVGVLGDRDDVADGLPPWQFVGVVLERADEHDRALTRWNPLREGVAIVEVDIFYADLIDDLEANDPVGDQLFSYNEYLDGVQELKDFFEDRKAILLSNDEIEISSQKSNEK